MKRMLYVSSNMTHIRHFHLEMIQSLKENGYLVDLASRDVPERIEGIHICYEIPFSKTVSFKKNRRAFIELRKIISTGNYDVLFCHTSLAAFFTRFSLLGKTPRPFVINMVHGYLFDDNCSFPERYILAGAERLTAPITDLLLTMNQWDTEYARKRKLGKCIVETKGMGFLLSRFPELPEDKTVLRKKLNLPGSFCLLIYPAEFSERKNQAYLISILADLPEHICLILPGDGALKTDCRRLAEDSGLQNRVFFPGYQKDLNLWYRAADVAVSSSLREGLPSNILEAMYCGLPVVASKVKGHTDLIQQNGTGFLCEDKKQWIQAIMCLYNDEKLREQIGKAGHLKAKEYKRETCIETILQIVMNADKKT